MKLDPGHQINIKLKLSFNCFFLFTMIIIIIIIIIVVSYIAHTSVTLKRRYIQYFPARYVGLSLNYETYSFNIAPFNGLQGAVAQYAAKNSQEDWGVPPSFSDKCTGYITCLTQHTGPSALRPIRRTKQWLRVLLMDTSVMNGTGTHTHLI